MLIRKRNGSSPDGSFYDSGRSGFPLALMHEHVSMSARPAVEFHSSGRGGFPPAFMHAQSDTDIHTGFSSVDEISVGVSADSFGICVQAGS